VKGLKMDYAGFIEKIKEYNKKIMSFDEYDTRKGIKSTSFISCDMFYSASLEFAEPRTNWCCIDDKYFELIYKIQSKCIGNNNPLVPNNNINLFDFSLYSAADHKTEILIFFIKTLLNVYEKYLTFYSSNIPEFIKSNFFSLKEFVEKDCKSITRESCIYSYFSRKIKKPCEMLDKDKFLSKK